MFLRNLFEQHARRRNNANRRKRTGRNARRTVFRGDTAKSLTLEPLEDRWLLAVSTWDGGGADDNWTMAANWVGDVAPSAGDDLVFDGTSRQVNNNDFAADTLFATITFSTGGWTLGGNRITLDEDISGGGSGRMIDSTAGQNTINLDIVVNATDDSSAIGVGGTDLQIHGVLEDSGDGENLTTSGTLILLGANTYTGATTINAGTVG